MTYPEALEFLNSFLNYEQVVTYRYPQDFSLDRMIQLLARLGNPHRRSLSLHVAGTKGKGSTCAFVASILQAAGYRVGLYTSPHLVSFQERIQVNRQPIPEEALADVVTHLQPLATRDLTFFEVTTACAFLYFAQVQVDIAVIEVGLGGRLDATNVLIPKVTAITPISLDHMPKLGNTLERIAREKAGIVKSGVPLVVAPQPRQALEIFREVARDRQAPLHLIEEQVQIEGVQLSPMGSRCRLRTPQGVYPDLEIPLLGRHQLMNAATAVRMVELLSDQRRESSLTAQAVREGLFKTIWPGRCQLLEGVPPILLDGAQNAASAQTLRATAEELFPERPVCLVLGVSLEKDLAGIASVLGPWAKRLILTRAQVPRAEPQAKLAEAFRAWHSNPSVTDSVTEALEQALTTADPKDLIVVTGSLFVVGEALVGLATPTAPTP